MAFDLEAFLDHGLKFGGYRPTRFDANLSDSDLLPFRINRMKITEYGSGTVHGELSIYEDDDFSTKAILPKPGSNAMLKVNFYAKDGNVIKSVDWKIWIDYVETEVSWAKVDQVMSYVLGFECQLPDLPADAT